MNDCSQPSIRNYQAFTPPSTDREELAKQEESLIRALLQESSMPTCTDDKQVAAAARSLLLKRARAIAKMDPDLLTSCGDAYIETMRAYSKMYPGVHPDGACADASRFRAYVHNTRHRRCDTSCTAKGGGIIGRIGALLAKICK